MPPPQEPSGVQMIKTEPILYLMLILQSPDISARNLNVLESNQPPFVISGSSTARYRLSIWSYNIQGSG